MARGRQSGATDFVAKAKAAWGRATPDWVLVLAEEASRTSATAAAQRIGYSTALVSNVIANKYEGDVERVADKVRGALMGVTVACPIVGEIGRDRCLDEQAKPFSAANSISARLFHACRRTGDRRCPHSRVAKE